MNGQAEVCLLLLSHGVDIHARESDGGTPLHSAAFYGHANVCELLLEQGADPSLGDNTGMNPLVSMCALKYRAFNLRKT